MKLKRTKLAALAMTALMAVGAMSLAAYAEEADTPATTASVNELAKKDGDYDVTWDTDFSTYDESTSSYGTVKVTYTVNNDSTSVSYTKTATVTLESKAACEEDAIVMASYTVTEVTPSITLTKNFTVADTALKHNYQWVTVKTTDATCTTEGTYTQEYTCTICGDVSETKTETASAALGHVYDETKAEKIVKGTNTTVSSDGTVTLVDPSLPGTYIIQKYCTREAKYVAYKTVTVPATTAATFTVTWNSVATDGNIVSIDGVTNGAEYDFYKYSSIVGGIELNDIELTNCAKAGKYVITLYDGAGNVFSTETVDVKAHDKTIVLVEFDSATDAAACTVTYKADGSYTLKNTNCSGSITYYEVTYCVATNHAAKASGKVSMSSDNVTYATGNNFASYTSLTCISVSSAKTVEGTGNHVIDKTTKDAVEAVINSGKTLTYVDDFYPLTSKYDYVTFTNTSTCTEAGTVTVNYICKVCGAVAGTATVDVAACGHDFKDVTAVTENMVPATCSSTGSFESVVYCAHKDIVGCTAEESRITVLIPRTQHTNETSVAANGTGTDDNYDTLEADNITIKFSGSVIVDPGDGSYLSTSSSTAINKLTTGDTISAEYQKLSHVGSTEYPSSLGVYVYAVSTCEVCGGNAVKIYNPVKVYITSITKEKTNGEAGSITLKAVYTRTNADGTTSTFTDTATFDYYSTIAAYQGRTVTTLSGLNLDSDGVYRYYVNNAVATTYTGFVEYNSATFFVANGVLCNTISGLAEYNGTFYYLANGQLQDQYTGMVEYNGEWFYIKNGVLDTLINGIVEYNGGSFLVAAGRLVQEYSGLYQDFDGTWYFLANGQVQSQFTGVTYYDGAFFKLVNGVLDDSFNGTIEYDGATFNVVAGQLYDQVA